MQSLFVAFVSLVFLFHWASFASNTGTYTVPLESEFASNVVESVLITEDNKGTTYLSYNLPEDLVGDEASSVEMTLVSVNQAGDSIVAKFKDLDSGSWALCQGTETSLSCTTEYEGDFYDQQKRDVFLNNKFGDRPEILKEKLRVAENFSGDPIGLLSVQCLNPFCGL